MKVFNVFIKPFEEPQRSVKIKSLVNFFTLSRIGAGRVKIMINTVKIINDALFINKNLMSLWNKRLYNFKDKPKTDIFLSKKIE